MNLVIVIRLFLCFSLSASIFVSCQQLKLEGSPKIGFLPEDAQKVCEKIGGTIATLTDDNRQFFTDNLSNNCDVSFCPKMCIWEKMSDKQNENPRVVGNAKIQMTQPIFPGDTLHLKLEMEPDTVEVFQISDSILENDLNSSTKTVVLQMTLFNKFTSGIKGTIMKTKTIKSGKMTENGNQFLKDSTFSEHEISGDSVKTMNGVIEFSLEFTEQKTLKISSAEVFGDEIIEKSIGVSPSGRMYFRKFYDKSKVLDVYFTRGNCFKTDFQFSPGNSSDGYLNCLWTRQTHSIPVYSCRKASYVACKDVPSPTTTDTSTSSMTSKTIRTTKLPRSTKTTTTTTTTTTKSPEPYYLHSEFLDDHILLFLSLSGLSLGLLIGSIVLQIMKMWGNRNVKVLKKKKRK